VLGNAGMSALERRVIALREAGLDEAAIAVKFRRSPRFIRQVLSIGELRKNLEEGRSGVERADNSPADKMSPRQRVVVKWRERGASYAEIASRLRRSPLYVRRIERLARLRSG